MDSYNRMLGWFDGIFDNEDQAIEDRRNCLDFANGYGHRHVTCHIFRLHDNRNFRQAIYTLDGDEKKVFRLRIYEFYSPQIFSNDSTPDVCVASMRLYRPLVIDYQAISVEIVRRQIQNNEPRLSALLQNYEYLAGCDIDWMAVLCPSSGKQTFAGSIRVVPCWIRSERDPSVNLRVEERICLTESEMSVNDRVYDLSGRLLHGDKGGVPYIYKKLR